MENAGVLTAEESKVLTDLAHGLAQKHIATKLGLSEEKVRDLLKSVNNKLGSKNRTESVAIAVRNGYIQ